MELMIEKPENIITIEMVTNSSCKGAKQMNDSIIIKGAKEHNLKNINLTIPRDKLVVITGLSGSR